MAADADAIAITPPASEEFTSFAAVEPASVMAVDVAKVQTVAFSLAPVPDAPIQRPEKARLVITMPPALPTDAITNDAVAGVWNAISVGGNLLS
jgi:hypothetical protein